MKNLFTARDDKGGNYEFEAEKTEFGFSLTLKKDKLPTSGKLYILGDLSRARAGEDGYYILSRHINNIGDPMVRFLPREDGELIQRRMLMSYYGIKRGNESFIVRIRRDYPYALRVAVKENAYTLEPCFDFDAEPPYTDLRAEIVILPSGSDYSAMAAAERNIRLKRGEIETLREKCGRAPVEYARKYPLIRIRQCWKPSPTPVPHQTPENEPEVTVKCDFAGVRAIADELKSRGVEGAELQLVGWNRGGHDGPFPQFFPVEEKLGGEAEMRRTVEYVKSLGYRISTHDNYIDSVELADTFSFDDVVVARDGKINPGAPYSSGLVYHVCSERLVRNAKREMPKIAALGENGLHFSDVISIILPDACYAARHPVHTGEAIKKHVEAMRFARETFGGFASEGGMDFAMKYVDEALYATFGDSFMTVRNPLVDDFLPLWELTYHGIVLYTPMSACVNYTIKGPKERLYQIMRGGKPAFYFYSKFKTGGEINWMGTTDLTCEGEDDLAAAADAIAEGAKEYAAISGKQLLYMTAYVKLGEGLERAEYEDGSAIVGNFSEEERLYKGKTIPPFGYIVEG